MKPFSTMSPHCCPDRQTDRQPHSSQDSTVLLLWYPPRLCPHLSLWVLCPATLSFLYNCHMALKGTGLPLQTSGCSVEGIFPNPCILHLHLALI